VLRQIRLVGGLEAGRLADEDDVDAAGHLLVDLEDFPDLAVLPWLVECPEASRHQGERPSPGFGDFADQRLADR
jgi:hypothetical protein